MYPSPLINKKTVRRNVKLKNAQKQEKRIKGKGSGKPLKNYLGKVVSLTSHELVGNESGVSNFIPGISKDDLLAALEKSGITGMSGNGFPIHSKIKTFLSSNANNKILLINAVECDPALLHDEWLLANRYDEIARSVTYLKQAFSLDQAVLAAKNKDVKPTDSFSVSVVPPRYPMGEEHFLIKQVLGISLEAKEKPAEHGILVLNVQSVYQICKIINQCYDGGRFVTIADLTNASAKIAYVYPTDNIANLLQQCFGEKTDKSMYRGYGAMACFESTETDAFSKHEMFAAYANLPGIDNANRCRHCGSCIRKCPAKVKAAKIVMSVDNNKLADYASYGLERCVRCGICTYFCPASKDVSGYMKELLSK
jgi:Na+-translocating ferredoxin:NAD+ oxidoreductase RnfC subunit